MEFFLKIDPPRFKEQINYTHRVMLIGSCFTEHIGNALAESRFNTLQNPNGILFDPASVCSSLIRYMDGSKLQATDLFQLNDVWNSWQHHSRFSHVEMATSLQEINASAQRAQLFLKQCDWLIITLGSAFSYRLGDEAPVQFRQNLGASNAVANCHRAPRQWFTKHLLGINEIIEALDRCLHQLFQYNPNIRVLFTISPVRHSRDGVVENNRSKARLIEAVHHMVNKFDHLYYFPAYELVIDVLRDYRFYDVDLVHPNYAATEFVLEHFAQYCLDEESRDVMTEVRKVTTARKHRPLHPDTAAHRQFLRASAARAQELQRKYPMLDLQPDIDHFLSAAMSS